MPKREWNDVPEGALKMSSTTLGSLELSPCRVTIPHVMIPSEAMAFGTAVHAVLEHVVTKRIPWVKAQTSKAIDQIVHEAFEDDPFDLSEKLNGFELDWYAEIGDAIAAFKPLYDTIHDNGFEVVEAEKPRARDRGHYWLVTGGIDLILYNEGTGHYLGADFKTSRTAWWKGDDGRARSQHDVYAYLAEPDYGDIDDWAYLVYDRSKQVWDTYHVQSTPATRAGVLLRMDEWAKFLALPDDVRPHLCTPTDGKKRAWYSKPDYNPVWKICPTCDKVGDEFDDKPRPTDKPWFS